MLVIAGSDSGGGAGIQADIKSVMAMGGYAATAITAITAQNTLGVQAVHMLPPQLVAAQIDSVLSDIGADAIKTGMLGEAAIVRCIAACLTNRSVPVVVDPVMIAKGGQSLLSDEALDAMRALLIPRAMLVTPNLPEAEALLGHRVSGPAEAAVELRSRGFPAVLVKGGHATGDDLVDALADDAGVHEFHSVRLATRHTHGTGCTMASAVAACLAQAMSLRDAIGRAHAYVQAAIRQSPGFGSGHGPLNHNVTWERAQLP